MSGKIKSKDLSYDSTLPPFLQRLHAQNAGFGDRHERPIPRPKKEKDPNDDDGPTIVQDSGDTLTKEEYERLAMTDDAEAKNANVDAAVSVEEKRELSTTEHVEQGRKQIVGASIAHKKRKVVKVIGSEEATDEAAATTAHSNAKPAKKAKKNAKPIKLAFEDG